MPEGGKFTSASYQSRHIELNLGNIAAVGALSLLWYIGANWISNWAARTDVPVFSQLGIGMQNALHALG